jgi:type II secretory ATPase GspE/PulE/Tfp pilus assembly ATPase PilB-like protein
VIPDVVYRGRGCRNCQNLGYRGRHAIFELMLVTDEIRSMIVSRVPSGEIRKVAQKQGMGSLRADGWRLVREGITTPDEVVSATKEEHVALPVGGVA